MWGGSNGHPDDLDETRRMSIEMALAQHTGTLYGRSLESDDDEDDDDDSEDEHDEASGAAHEDEGEDDDDDRSGEASVPGEASAAAPMAESRGKPEVMAAKLASAARMQQKMDELEAEREAEVVVAEPIEEGEDVLDATVDTIATIETQAAPAPPPKKKKKRPSAPKKKPTPPALVSHRTMDDPVLPVTSDEYDNLEQLMEQFCRVPLLAEFSRPVALLHPELMQAYSRIVEHPVDLGVVCRKVRKREYECLRDIQLDAWRIFSNCVQYHSHPSNKEAVPSFVSIALHLRNFFNALWQEHMLASDPPKQSSLSSSSSSSSKSKQAKTGPEAQHREAFAKRKEDRKKRLVVTGLSVMTGKSLARAADTLGELLKQGGCVDKLDAEPIFGDRAAEDEDDLEIVVDNLRLLQARFRELSASGADYGIDELESDVKKCYTHEVLENNPGLQMRIAHRLDRWIGKIVVPIHEATCRGVSQSSIWGCMAAAVWARESSKKPFWPALVLGIMAPDHQREDWHLELTERNESRLPEKLKGQLITGKRKAESSLKKQSQGQMEAQSFFLVEFLGTHEFIWVREADIVEDFDPNDDPNRQDPPSGSKKKRSSRSNIANVIGSKTYASAVEEAGWALEEFELQLQDVGSDGPEDDDEGYSYPVLCQSDEEADEIHAEVENKKVDLEQLNELLATDGLIDYTTTGRKNAKKRAQAMKKQKADAEKKLKADKAKKIKAEQNKKRKDAKAKERESKKEQKELEKKRKKRAREREKALKGMEPKSKKRKLDHEEVKKATSGRRNLIAGKRDRASAIVQGYLHRAHKRNHYKTLCLGGVMTIPASLIDSTGILGMAMAFRAAAGELPMPDESGAEKSNAKPWDKLSVEGKKKSSERVEILQQQMAMLEKEIARLASATTTRKELAEAARREYDSVEEKLQAEDKAARENPLKKKTPVSAEKKSKGKAKSPSGKGGSKPTDMSSVVEVDAASHEAGTAASNEGEDVAHVDADAVSSVDEAIVEGADDKAAAVEFVDEHTNATELVEEH